MNAYFKAENINSSNESYYFSARLLALYFIAISGSLGTAISALGRLTLLGTSLLVLLLSFYKPLKTQKNSTKYFTVLTLLTIAYLALSISWSSVVMQSAVQSWARQARILSVPLIYLLIRNSNEARNILRIFVLGQLFVVFSASMLAFGFTVPWATAHTSKTHYAVFGSYLEQSITHAILVSILWFTRNWVFGKNGKHIAVSSALITVVLTLGFLKGRSGHLALIGMLAFIVLCELPKKIKWMAVFAPFILLLIAVNLSVNFKERVQLIQSEAAKYSQSTSPGADTSTGLRLKFWGASINAFIEKPMLGYGVGSWKIAFAAIEKLDKPENSLTDVDPHQMFLLWAVEGGLVGLLLQCAVLVALLYHSKKLDQQNAYALQAVVLGLAISGMFNSMLIGIGIGDYFCILIGILVSIESQKIPSQINISNKN